MLLTVREVAERLRLSRSCVYALIEAGQLGHVLLAKKKKAIRVGEDQLEAYLTKCRREPRD